MKAVGDLDRIWRTTPRTIGVDATSITADDLNARMRLQPGGHGIRRAVGQDVYDAAPFEIDEDCAVPLRACARPSRQCPALLVS